jgi:DNA-binding winged helix-turn-helix (wHTH) protein/tetratricopeptide (TPR) repeat protein
MGRPRLTFLGFVLDPDQRCLHSESGRVSLSPKDCALLYHLAANAGRIITHAELLRAAWGATSVGPDVLKVRVARIRRLLGDNADAPRFIANVHGEGYRFVPPRDRLDAPDEAAVSHAVVGREQELRTLEKALSDATAGVRQMLFITGEPGIGKTTVIDQFVGRVGARARIGRGQCIEHYGRGEPYLPVMEALTDLGRHDESGQLTRLLERYAPSWLIQLPALLDIDQRQHIGRRVLEPSRERMLRELAEALEAHDESGEGGNVALVLVLEDLHWADVSTLDLLQMLARRRERARLLVLSTHRSLGPVPSGDPLRRIVQDLRIRGSARELPLGRLGEADVTRFLDQQFPGNTFERRVVTLVHRRTAGHPLFLTELVRDLQARGVVARVDGRWAIIGDAATVSDVMPSSVSDFLARQRETFSEEDRRLLEAASIAGLEFSTADLAAALRSEPAVVDEQCLRLANGRLYLQVLASEEWPDGTRSMRFGFPHALHQELWERDVSHSRAEEWHLRIAERREGAYGARASEIAPALAAHFEHGRDYQRAVLYREHAGRLALQRAATLEAKEHINHALQLLAKLPDTDDRRHLELRLQIGVASVSALSEGLISEGAVAASRRAYDICRESTEAPELIDAIFGLCRFFWARGDLIQARELGDKMQAIARRGDDPIRVMAAFAAYGSVLAMRGETAAAASALRDALSLAKVHWRDDLIGAYGGDLEMISAGSLANTLLVAGYADEALQVLDDAVFVAERRHPITKVGILYGAALFHQLRNDAERALSFAVDLRRAAASHKLSHYAQFAEILCGWGLAATGKADQATAALTSLAEMLRRSGEALWLPHVLLLLTQAYRNCGKLPEARQILDDALAAATHSGGTVFDAEIHRLDGELTCQTDADGCKTAEAAFNRALAVSRTQGAKLWELRAAMSLARMWQGNGRGSEARSLVSDTYALFTEGFDTPDLAAARTFLK